MPEQSLRVLIVEDSLPDARLIQHALAHSGYTPVVTQVDDEPGFAAALAAGPDVILCDWNLPQFDALRALEIVREQAPEVPFLIVSGSIGEEAAVQAMKLGASDYLLKDRLGRLGQAVKQALVQHDLRATERRAREELRSSEEKYRALADSLPQLVWTVRPDGELEYLNHRSREYTGQAAVGLAGWNWESVIHPTDASRVLGMWTEVLRTGVPRDVEFRIRRSDGEYRWHISRQVAVRDSSGAIVRWVGTCTDIHDQKTTAEMLARDAQILASVRDSVIVTDLEGVVAYWNEGATRLFGWTAEEMIGRPYADRFPDPVRQVVAEEIRKRTEGSEWQGEYEDYRKDGTRVWIHARVCPFADATDRVVGVLGLAYDLTDRKRAEESLAAVMRSVNDGIITIDESGTIQSANPAVERIFGYPEAELVGRNIGLLMPEPPQSKHEDYIGNYLRTGSPKIIGIGREIEALRKDGRRFPADLSVTEFWVDGERFFTGVVRDITERKRLEEQYRQAQKMEAVGQLAGGVAHDFNNLLTVINGYGELVAARLPSDHPAQELIQQMVGAGERAVTLTRQLLAFSRKAMIEPRVLDLEVVVADLSKMLRRIVGEDVRLTVVANPDSGAVKADLGQIEQVILNLVVNSRDAMPRGGELTIGVRNIDLDEASLRNSLDAGPGRHVLLSVSDTGCGMDRETLSRIFEPFFTTKGERGTGLGLATVHGIVKQSGGHITTESAVGVGTTFNIYLPRVPREGPAATRGQDLAASAQGGEIVLLVEDETAVRVLACAALRRAGYKVLEAHDAATALPIVERHTDRFDLLVTDVVMPGMSGRELAERVRGLLPEVKVLFVSGYTDDAVVRHGILATEVAFLQKPFTPSSLVRKVREVLDRPAPPIPGTAPDEKQEEVEVARPSALRVILVDDHPIFRAGLRKILDKRSEIEIVAEGSDGREAIGLVEQHHPDLVFMDVAMSGLNGLEATARISKEFPGVRVVILSAYADQEHVWQALRAGAVGYILKHGDPAEIEQALDVVAGGGSFITSAVSKHIVAEFIRSGGTETRSLELLTARQRETLQLLAEGPIVRVNYPGVNRI
jgi:PAS domain S-box-containing protein